MKRVNLTLCFAVYLSTFVSCKQNESSSASNVSADGKGAPDIAFAVREVEDGDNDEKAVLIASAPGDYDQVTVCGASDVSECTDKSAGYQKAERLPLEGSRSFFILDQLALEVGGSFVVKASDSDGEAEDLTRAATYAKDEDAEEKNDSDEAEGETPEIAERQVFPPEDQADGAGEDEALYRIWAPASNSPDKPHPLVVYLHGDTGSNFGPREIYPQVDERYESHGQDRPTLDQARFEAEKGAELWNEVIFVSILSPSDNGRFITWTSGLNRAVRDRHADMVHGLVQHLTESGDYHIDANHVYFVGQSGGAIFLSATFMPRYGTEYKGGAVMLCGGEPPRQDLQFTPSEEFKDHFAMHFQTTEGEYDRLAPAIRRGFDSYRQILGVTERVTYEKKGDGGHCQFPTQSQPTLLNRVLSRMMDLNEPAKDVAEKNQGSSSQ